MHVQRVLLFKMTEHFYSLNSISVSCPTTRFFFSVIGAAVISFSATRLQHLLFFFIISYNLEIVVVFSLFTEKS